MSLYMDRHDIPGLTAEEVAMGHLRDLELQDKYGVKFLTYWFDDTACTGFCLVEAPSKETVEVVHQGAHGLIPTNIIEVNAGVVKQFLGKIEEPPPGEPWVETAFRAIVFNDIEGSTTMTQRLGDARAMEVLRTHDAIVRDALGALGGSEVKHTGDGIMASFSSAVAATECAIAIQRKLDLYNAQGRTTPLRVRVGISAGEPVTESDDLFGAAVQMASRICDYAEPGCICVSSVVRDISIGKGFLFSDRGEVALKGFGEPVRLYEVGWREAQGSPLVSV